MVIRRGLNVEEAGLDTVGLLIAQRPGHQAFKVEAPASVAVGKG
ncbi:hypothetical protein ABNQ39_14200 [Azospirillum sp. A26]